MAKKYKPKIGDIVYLDAKVNELDTYHYEVLKIYKDKTLKLICVWSHDPKSGRKEGDVIHLKHLYITDFKLHKASIWNREIEEIVNG